MTKAIERSKKNKGGGKRERERRGRKPFKKKIESSGKLLIGADR